MTTALAEVERLAEEWRDLLKQPIDAGVFKVRAGIWAYNAIDALRSAAAHAGGEADIEERDDLIFRLQRALHFWLPSVQGGGQMEERLANDAYLLIGYDGPLNESAEQLGWIMVTNWRAIDSAPHHQDVIVTNGTSVGEARFHDDAGWFWAGAYPTDATDGAVYGATHWQPLPAPPAADGAAE